MISALVQIFDWLTNSTKKVIWTSSSTLILVLSYAGVLKELGVVTFICPELAGVVFVGHHNEFRDSLWHEGMGLGTEGAGKSF